MVSDSMEVGTEDVAPLPSPIIEVTCESCGHATKIMDHPVAGHEQRWRCDCAVSYVMVNQEKQPTKPSGLCDCAAANLIPGDPGEPGEGALNPAASAVSHGDLVEAATRRLTDTELIEAVEARGITHKLNLAGGAEPAGTVDGSPA